MKDFRALDKNLKLRLAIVFLGAFSYGTVFSSMTIYYNQYLGATLTGILLALSAVATFVSGLIAGHFADKFGRKPTMVWGTEFFIVGSIIAAASNSPLGVNAWTTFFGFLLVSIGFNFMMTSGNAMMIDVSDASNRKTVFALDYWAQNLSIILGAALGSWLFKPAFFILLILLVIETISTFIITKFFISETKPEELELQARESIFHAYATVIKDKTYMLFLVANILAASIIMQFDNYLPVHLADNFQTVRLFGWEIYGQRMFTIYLIIACVLVVFLMQTFNHLTANWSHQRSFVWGTILMALGMIGSFLTVTMPPIVLASVVYTLGEMIYTPAAQTIGANLMPADKIGAYNGASSIRQPLASILASSFVTVSPLIKSTGVSILLGLSTGLAVVLLIWALRRNRRLTGKEA